MAGSAASISSKSSSSVNLLNLEGLSEFALYFWSFATWEDVGKTLRPLSLSRVLPCRVQQETVIPCGVDHGVRYA